MGDSTEDEEERVRVRCSTIRDDLKMCLLKTDCCTIQKRLPRDCLRSRDPSVPERCYHLWELMFNCKHSILDGKRRFRGARSYD